MSAPPPPDRRFATTLARGLSVLRAFRVGDEGLGNAEIARRTGLHKATVSRLTHTLTTLGYLTQPAPGGPFHPGPALLVMGHVAQASLSFLALADGPMRALADATGTLVFLGVRDGDKALLAKTWRPGAVASLWLETGHRVALRGSATGWAIMAGMDDAMLARALADQPPGGLGHASAAQIRAMAQGQIAAQGWVAPPPEWRNSPRIASVAVPFRSAATAEPIAFACGATPQQLGPARLAGEVGPRLRRAVEAVAAASGQIQPFGPPLTHSKE